MTVFIILRPLYLSAKSTREKLNKYRGRLASILGANNSEVIFTAGASEANNLAVRGTLDQHGGKALISAIEHDAVVEPAGSQTQIVPVDKYGVINLSKFGKINY